MANQEHLDILKQGVEVWNEWREEHPEIRPDLSGADLSKSDLSRADLSDADLSSYDPAYRWASYSGKLKRGDRTRKLSPEIIWTDLSEANLSKANLSGAYLLGADLEAANLEGADLYTADLLETDLTRANLNGANLYGVDLHGTKVGRTVFGFVDLSTVRGLETVKHEGPSTIGIDTLVRSKGNIPEVFLRKAGVPEEFIDFARSLSVKPIQYYTCFISYSSRDQAFVERLYNDLQAKEVRCWFAPRDLKIGDKFWQRIDDSIRFYDKLLVVISQHSIESEWVEREVMAALEKEKEHKKLVLFPIRLDDTVMKAEAAWAANIRRSRHIGDFIYWKQHDKYQIAFERLLRDLKAQT